MNAPTDAAGRTALVTGGTDGIGKSIAMGLAKRGTRVLLVGRDPSKGIRAAKEIAESTGNPDIDFLAADLRLMNEAGALASTIAARLPELHYLVHCAGIVAGKREVTKEGIESNFAVNYLSRFALTVHLLPLLESGGRLHHAARILIYFDDVNLTKNFGNLRAVGQFCRANDVFTVELARRLAVTTGVPRVTVACLKIGVVKTSIRRTFPRWMKVLAPLVIDPLLARTPAEVAAAALHLLLHKSLEGVNGALFMKIRKVRRLAPSDLALKSADGERLWHLSQNLCRM